ncbi:MAG: hypothetical protein SFZ23_15335 [Planctomycetota bacterium]|nr:hypothetical protein [Planctomycetota bacterium]
MLARSFAISVLAGVACSASAARAQCASSFNFPSFPPTSSLSLVGNAFIDDIREFLILTPDEVGQRGAAYYTTELSRVVSGFETRFAFNLGFNAGDGFTFIIQLESPTALGSGGSGIGFASGEVSGITRSVAIEFDTFAFSDEFPEDHVSVQSNGNAPNDAADDFSLASAILPFDLNDGQTHEALITYENGFLRVYLDDLVVPIINTPLDLEDLRGEDILSGESCAWIGFTAGTGAATAEHAILQWDFLSYAGGCRPVDLTSFQPNVEFVQGETAVFEFDGTGSLPRAPFWRRTGEAENLQDGGRISGATTQRLTITDLQPSDSGNYDYGLTNDCSGVGTGFSLLVFCQADVNRDQQVDFFDYLDFVFLLDQEDSGADFNHDGQVDFFDYLDFAAAFSVEC